MEPVVAPRTFQGRYEVTHLIARGGMAQVYRALDTRLGRHVALKVLFPELSVDRAFVERFRREAQAAANLSHPNVVAVYDWGEDEGTYFIVMELITGTSLATALRAERTMPATRAATIAAQVASALAYAHRHGVVHRDIKPGNVLLTEDGQVKVTDFGIAQAVSTEEGLTMAGSVMGTAAYFSPEQAEGAVVDGRSDIYSLGVVLFEMLAGRAPFVGDSPVAVASMHVRNAPPVLHDLNPAVPAAIEAVTARAMQKSPADRYQSAEELRADLLRFCEGRDVLAGAPVVGGLGATSVLEVGSTSVLQAVAETTVFEARDNTFAVPVVAGAAVGGATGVLPVPPVATPPTPPPPPAPEVAAAGGAAPPEREGRARRSVAVYVAIALLVAVAAVAALVVKSLAGPTTLHVPNVVGRDLGTARSILAGEGFKIGAVTKENNALAAGKVISTTPAAGTVVRPGRTIAILYSLGPIENVTVPKVVGDSPSAAETALQLKGLTYGFVTANQWDAPVIPDTVLAQSVAPGMTVRSGTKVLLQILSGTGTYPVPSVAMLSAGNAGAELAKYGLAVGNTKYQCSSTVGDGDVISTQPAQGQQVQAGTTVNLTVSNGQCPVPVPNLLGLTEAQAQSALAMAQLGENLVTACPMGETSTGVVAAQDPTYGQTATPGSTVTVTIGCTPSGTTTTTTTMPGQLPARAHHGAGRAADRRRRR